MATVEPGVFTVDEAAAYLGVSPKTIRRQVAQGNIPGVVWIGRTLRIGRQALYDYVNGSRR